MPITRKISLRPSVALVTLLTCKACVLPDYLLDDESAPQTKMSTGGEAGSTPVATGGMGVGVETGGSTAGGSTSTASNVIYDGTNLVVSPMDNTLGITGRFYVLEDGVDENRNEKDDGLIHTNLHPDSFGDTHDVCVSGVLGVPTTPEGTSCLSWPTLCNYGEIWGGGLGINLNEREPKKILPLDISSITGFDFKLSGNVGGATIRFKLVPTEGPVGDFCSVVFIGSNRVALSDLQYECWPGGAHDQTLDLTRIESIHFQLVTSPQGPKTITDFCLESLSYY